MSTYKRLIICCDGTWQQSDGACSAPASNITKLCRAIHHFQHLSDTSGHPPDASNTLPDASNTPPAASQPQPDKSEIQQVTYYQSGVGTHSGNHPLLKAASTVEAAFGIGLAEKVLEAYTFLVNNFDYHGSKPDEIFLFGFSRGAFTVRCLAGLIDCVGIIEKDKMENFHRLYDRYMKRETLDLKNEKHGTHVKIKVIGVWDTVGAVGVPDFVDQSLPCLRLNRRHNFHRPMLSPNVENAFQALALDERRTTFSPLLWYIPREKKADPDEYTNEKMDSSNNKAENPVRNLVQCWFPGVHIDVGGGGSSTILSDISFFWMLDLLAPFLRLNERYLNGLIKNHCKDLGKTFDTKQGWLHCFACCHQRCKASYDWAVGPLRKSLGIGPRTPGKYRPPKDLTEEVETREMMHPSVRVRREILRDVWHPSALRGLVDSRSLGSKEDSNSWFNKRLRRGTKPDAHPLRGEWTWVSKERNNSETSIPEYSMIGYWEMKLANRCETARKDAERTAWSMISRPSSLNSPPVTGNDRLRVA